MLSHAHGTFRVRNTGEAFEVSPDMEAFLLTRTIELDGETIRVFVKVETNKSELDEAFPLREELAENKIFTLHEVKSLVFEDHLRLKNIGPAGIKKIIDAASVLSEA